MKKTVFFCWCYWDPRWWIIMADNRL